MRFELLMMKILKSERASRRSKISFTCLDVVVADSL